jgi:hypothetical protein
MSASETAFSPVIGAGTTETMPSSVASIVTAPIIATTPLVPAPVLQTQTASLPRLSTEGQPDSSESEEDTSQFVITPCSSTPDTTAYVPPSDP